MANAASTKGGAGSDSHTRAPEWDWNILQAVLDAGGGNRVCFAYLDRDFRLLWFSQAYAQKWGADETGLLEGDHFQMSPGRQNRAVLEQVCETGEVLSCRARPCVRSGEGQSGTTHWDWTLAPVKDATGKVLGLVLSLLDVTEDVEAPRAQRRGQSAEARSESRAQAALHRQNEELMALTRELDAFAHTVAHDLRQPLTMVMGFADMLNEEIGSGLGDQEKRMLEGIRHGARRMRSMVEGLLLLASTRSAEIEPMPLNMADIVQEVLHAVQLAGAFDEAGTELIVPATWPRSLGYGPWVESVWTNYLTNAIKYGGRPLRIELGGAEKPGGLVRFWVQDHGPGLTPEEQSRLFTSFTRLGQPRSLGHGLGLTIVRRIVERLGGEVGVESEPGKGSTFWFTLPAAPA